MFAAISNVTANGIKFNGQNYDDWIEYVKLNAGLLGLDSALVMDEPTKPTDTSLEVDKKIWENWERSNRLMMSFLKLSIAPNVKPSQPKTENVREFVAEIKKCTMKDIVDKSIVVALINDLSNREYTIAQSMEEHISHMVNTYNRLKSLDMDLGERVSVEFLLKSCKGDDFKQFRRTYNQLKEKWSLSDTKAMLMQEEARQREDLKVKLPQANFADYGKSNAGSSGGKAPSKKWKNKGKQPFKVQPGKGQGEVEKILKCFFCNKPGHKKADFQKGKAWFEKRGIHFVSVCFESNLIEVSSNTWWLDTGAITHVSNVMQGYLNFHQMPESESFLFMGNRMKARIEGVGTYRIVLDTGYCLDVEKCLYVPDCSRNLVSVSRLDVLGFDFRIGHGCFSLYHGINLYGTGSLSDTLYCLNLNSTFVNSLFNVDVKYDVGMKRSALNESSADLWHKRLGHISKERILRLIKSEVLPQLDFTDWNNTCVDCIKGKQTKHVSKQAATRSSGLLDLIHTDICGPFDVPSWGGERYFITFIDDYSRYCYLYLLHERTQSVDVLETFISEVERQLNKKVKVIRSDRGGEYYGKTSEVGQIPGPFKKLLEFKGICAQYTMPGSPHQNGIAERRNRTLMEMVRSIVNDSFVPVSLWTYALRTAAYILNRVPSKAVPKTPYELWTSRKPSLRHLHVWGCQAEVRIYNPHEKKLDSMTISCYFIGYPERSIGYRFYCPNHSTRIVESGNARFIENGSVSRSVGARDVEIRESLMNQSPSIDPSQIEVPIIVAQPQGMNMEQQQIDAPSPIMDAIV